jgi:mRNA interferase MazF
VTSKPYGDPLAIAMNAHDFASGGLKIASFVRPGKLFTANRALLISSVGKLTDAALNRLIQAVVNLLTPAQQP